MLFVIVELIAGFFYNSLALISDAGHNFSDVISLVLALVAFKLSKLKANQTFTYGYRKFTVLVSLLNAMILLIAIGSIAWESIYRLQNPQVIEGQAIAGVATIGILINTITALMFSRDKEKDLNVKGAYLHLAADALVSLGVVIAGFLILYTHWFWLDAVISLIIALVIFLSTWGLLKDSFVLSLDGVPNGIDLANVKAEILKTKAIKDIHHLHIWAISTTLNALTAHLIVDEKFDLQQFSKLKNQIKHDLEHLNIQHTTLELEIETEDCEKEDC
jgi:cobalt-zinc-cadmium efflux system protein